MTSIDRSPTGPDSRRSSGRSTPTSQVQRQMTPTNFNSVEIKNSLLGAAVSTYKVLDVNCWSGAFNCCLDSNELIKSQFNSLG